MNIIRIHNSLPLQCPRDVQLQVGTFAVTPRNAKGIKSFDPLTIKF